MSMICGVLGVSPAQIAALKATPALASYLAMHAEEAQIGASVAPGLLAALGSIGAVLDLHKSWHVLHYLFTGYIGPTEPPADALMSGEELGEDMGYGPPRLHDAAATKAFGEFLKQQTPEKLDARLNLAAMQGAGVYAIPMGPRASAHDEVDLREEVAAYFGPLRDYVVEMAEKKNGLLIWLS
jgi:hypothetical protein